MKEGVCARWTPTHSLGAGAPARLAFGIGTLRLALSRKGAAIAASGALLSSGWSAKQGGGSRICLFPRGARAHPCGCTRAALARVLAHRCKRFRPFGARAREGSWVGYKRR
ncbi:MAG: hypothetical protein IKK58_01660 [Clostridia bacterium]|nr:hypothetical protein [Clostridia bacterium]